MNFKVLYKMSGYNGSLTLARFFIAGHYLGQLVFRPDEWGDFRVAAEAAGSIEFEFIERN